MGIITASVGWKYVEYVPYAFPNLTVTNIMKTKGDFNKMIPYSTKPLGTTV
jgi:hypothetical protein